VTDYYYTAVFLVATYVYAGLGLSQMIASRRRTGSQSFRTRHIKGAMRLTAPPLASLLQHIVYLLFLSLSLSSLVAWRLSLLAAGVPAAVICEYAAVRLTRGSSRSGRTGGAAGPPPRHPDLEAPCSAVVGSQDERQARIPCRGGPYRWAVGGSTSS